MIRKTGPPLIPPSFSFSGRHCRASARSRAICALRINRRYVHLDAAELVKHVLGLRRCSESACQLLYLYYDVPGPSGAKRAQEIHDFVEVARQDGLTVMSAAYQDVLMRLGPRATWRTSRVHRLHGRTIPVENIGQRDYLTGAWHCERPLCPDQLGRSTIASRSHPSSLAGRTSRENTIQS